MKNVIIVEEIVEQSAFISSHLLESIFLVLLPKLLLLTQGH
jgi:hypothetical protein